MTTRLQKASEVLLYRLLIWERLHAYHVEVGDVEVTLPVSDLWGSADQATINEFNAARAEARGERPLFEDAI